MTLRVSTLPEFVRMRDRVVLEVVDYFGIVKMVRKVH